ncbi:MAG TPA: EAL domain-containing protein, partial [Kurthia sp.]
MIESYEKVHKMTEQIGEALLKDQFKLYYQPIVQSDANIVSFEALLRWDHPERGIISPALFFPYLEETGMMIPIGEWVVTELVKQLATWNSKYSEVNVSFNLSMSELFSRTVIQKLVRNCDWYDVRPEQITVELTESMQSPDDVALKRLVDEIRDYGFRIAIDDFGTGYASLEKILTIQPDYLKLDRLFVEQLSVSTQVHYVLEAIVQLAQRLQVDVIVEGVE